MMVPEAEACAGVDAHEDRGAEVDSYAVVTVF